MNYEAAPMILDDFAAFLAALIAEALDHGLPDEAIAVALEEAAAVVRGGAPCVKATSRGEALLRSQSVGDQQQS